MPDPEVNTEVTVVNKRNMVLDLMELTVYGFTASNFSLSIYLLHKKTVYVIIQ